MRKTTFLTRVLALVLSVMLVLTGMPMAVFAEEDQPSETQETLDASEITESSTDEAATGTGEDTVEDQPVTEETEDAAELEPDDVLSEVTPDDAETDLSVEDGNPDETVTDAEIVLDEEEFPVIDEAEDEIVWEDEEQDDYMIVERPMLRSAINPSRFTGAEEVRLGKEGNNIYGIIVQKDGSSSTSITRHWVTVDGVKYTAFCIESSDASTSGRDGGLEPGMDAGLLWILCNVPDTSDEDYAIKQQAIWAYLGQSFSIRNLAAGSRCSLSTDQLRERLTDIVTNAQNATITGTQELWIAYHLDNRDYYQDMAFIVDEPEPTPTPVPTPTPIPLEPGMIQVMKQDAQTGAMLAGATFELISGSTVIATGTTGPDGVVVFVNIMPGTYTIREASAPEGYTLGDVTVQSATVANAQLVTVAFANDKRSSCIRILKTDAQTGEPLEGARFMITRLTGPSVVSGMAIGESITLETDVNGEIGTGWLEWGRYRVEEIAAPAGYINGGFCEEIDAYEDGQVYTFTVQNVLMEGGIQVIKTDSDTGEALSGATFEVLDAEGNVVATGSTNADGAVYFTDLVAGNYTVREVGAPTGYSVALPDAQTVTVVAGQTASAYFANERITGKIAIYKIDADTRIPLEGATFTITDDTGAVVATLVTDMNGTAESGWLPYGTYDVTETAAPDHYINDGKTTTINVTEDGRTYTIEVENKAMTGGLIVRKKDALTGAGIADVQFDIYRDGALVATMTTDSNGVATCTGLETGSYTVKEHALPSGYVGELVVMEGEVASDVTTVLDVTNMPSQSRIQIMKTDAVSGDVLAGAVFAVCDEVGNTVAELTTGEDGTATTDWLPYGTYTVTEISAPAGFANSSTALQIDAFEDGRTYIIEVENTPTVGGIKVIKVDSLTQMPIAGVQFDVYQGSTLIGSMTTNDQGVAFIDGIEKGTYTVKEHALPTGYVGELAEMTVTVEACSVAEAIAVNTPAQSKIRIIKTDSVTGGMLPGAEFSVADVAGNIVAELTTGEDGTAESGWLPYGTYFVSEVSAPDGYANSGSVTQIDAYEDGKIYTIEIENAPTVGGIKVVKVDSLTQMPIAGVQFDVYQNDVLIGTMTTDAQGVACMDGIQRGTYIVKEHALPSGYVGELVEMTAVVETDQTAELTASNMPSRSKVRIIKHDALTGEALEGATFSIANSDGAVVATLVTDSDGTAESDWLMYGTYTITETAAPEHYVNDGFVEVIDAYEDGKTYEFTVSNTPTKGGIRLTKVDGETGALLAGVKFNIFRGDVLIATMTTDENGVAACDGLEKGTYIVKEDALPEGYAGELAVLEAVVQSDAVTELEAVNYQSKSKIRIVKFDELTGELLSGAEFSVYDENGNVVAVMTTGDEGEVSTDWLPYGVYTVKETRTPDHYNPSDWSQTVAAYENGTTYTFEVPNTPTAGWIQLIKTDSMNGRPIAGVVFDIFLYDEHVGTMTTDTNGVAVSESLTKGKYTVIERNSPVGYTEELFSTECEVRSDETTELTATNEPIQGKIRIVKKDQLTGNTLAGAEFTITRVTGVPAHNGEGDGEVVAVIVTDENGTAETPLLTYGVYRVEETKVPEHYVDNHFSQDVSIETDNLQIYELVVENEPGKGWIRITKTDSLDGHTIAGVTFNVYYHDDYGTGLACTMTTDENGVAVSEPLRKGRYLIQEEDEAEGYVYDLVELRATVESDETTYLSVTNQPIQGILRIRKQDELTGEALAGAEFTITRVTGLPSHNGEGNGEVVAVIVTDSEGVAVSPLLTYGVYRVEETKVPPHYVDNDFSTEMVINEENNCTYEITVENEPSKGWLRLTKTDRANGNPIEGVVFEVYYNDRFGQELATTMVTDKDGVAVSEPLRKGQYLIRERGATDGYVFEEIILEATVHSDETTELAVTNQPVMVRLKLYKRDADEYDGDPAAVPGTRGDAILTGAEFKVLAAADILDRQGNVVYTKGEVVVPSLKTSGEDASVITELLWPGKYEIVELTPPTGYQPASKSIMVDARSAAKQSEEDVIVYDGVVKNKVLVGAQAIVKILGSHTTDADPTRVETPEKGAEFRVYLASAGSYENARKFERDILRTDKNGYAMTKSLPYGVYVLEQTKGKEGYEIKGPITFEIDGTESLVNPPPLTLADNPIMYRLKIIKVDSETGRTITLSNTSFKLKDANGEYVKQKVFYPREQVIDTFTTDDTGSVTLPETVTWGLYTLEEVKAPEGYLIRSDGFSVFVGNSGDQPGETYELEIEIPNDPVKGRILLDKRGLLMTGVDISEDAWGNKVHTPVYEVDYLAGAVFEVRAAEDVVGNDGTIWYQQGDLVDTITTTDQGNDASKTLPLGKYNLIEISAPAGYYFESYPIAVDLCAADDHTAIVEVRVTAENEFLPASIQLWKEQDEIHTIGDRQNRVKSFVTTAPGEGCVFGLYTAKDIPYTYGTLLADTLVATGCTDNNGTLVFSGRYPHGSYYIRELYAPDGWKICADRMDVELSLYKKADNENILRVLNVDAIHNDLIYTNVTLTKTDITGLKTLPGATIEVYNANGEVIYRDVTDENGQIANIPVTPGRYTFRETYAPDGYALTDAFMSFEVSEDGIVTGDTIIRDDYTRFFIEKYDENESPMAGVEFSLIRADGTIIMTATTNRNGVATFEAVPYGKYQVVETRPLAGYEPADIAVDVTVDGTFINPEEPLAIIVNVPNEIVIRKVDQDGKPLAGAEFGLFDAFGDRFAVSVSDHDGMVRFHKVPYGTYTIRELSAPDGYLLSKHVVEVRVDASYRSGTPVATVVNHSKQVRFIKVDTSGKFLPGVEFSLINAVTYEVVETATSNSNGEFVFRKFDYGDWIIRETEAPEGYSRMEDYLLHVDENWKEPAPITLVNIPSTYMFFKSDNRKRALPGATFAVEDAWGNVVQEVVSGEDGVVYIYGLTPGRYTIREIATVEGYAVNDDTIEVVIDENYRVPTKLKRFVNYPRIAAGVDVSPTTLTWIGVGLFGTAGVILLACTFRRKQRKSR